MTAGRPTKYSPEMLQKAESYLTRCQRKQEIPFVEELALELGVNDDTLVKWSGEHDEFSATLRLLRTLQKLHLKRDALYRKAQSNVAIFLLKANHGLNEKEPDIPKQEYNHIVTFFDAEKALEEINQRLTEKRAGRIDGELGHLRYLSQTEAAENPPVSNEKPPANAAEAIARANRI